MNIPHANKLPKKYKEGFIGSTIYSFFDPSYEELKNKGYFNKNKLTLLTYLIEIENLKAGYKEGLYDMTKDEFCEVLNCFIQKYNELASEILD